MSTSESTVAPVLSPGDVDPRNLIKRADALRARAARAEHVTYSLASITATEDTDIRTVMRGALVKAADAWREEADLLDARVVVTPETWAAR